MVFKYRGDAGVGGGEVEDHCVCRSCVIDRVEPLIGNCAESCQIYCAIFCIDKAVGRCRLRSGDLNSVEPRLTIKKDSLRERHSGGKRDIENVIVVTTVNDHSLGYRIAASHVDLDEIVADAGNDRDGKCNATSGLPVEDDLVVSSAPFDRNRLVVGQSDDFSGANLNPDGSAIVGDGDDFIAVTGFNFVAGLVAVLNDEIDAIG